MSVKRSLVLLLLLYSADNLIAQPSQKFWKFDFGSEKIIKGYSRVMPSDIYSTSKRYGFIEGGTLTAGGNPGSARPEDNFIGSDKPFFFTVDLPEGNYDVKVSYGDKAGTSSQVMRVECRRMMVQKAETQQGQISTANFTVNLHTPDIAGTDQRVKLKPRELAYFHWDKQLTIEFNGEHPKISSVEIRPAEKPVTVFLAGNSTVVDQSSEPYASWGQMIPSFFVPGKVVVANFAESGEALYSFRSAKRLDKILSMMKSGDYLFIEFGHNDQKRKGEGIGPFTSYKNDLIYYVTETRKKGGIPVLVTSMHRRSFDESGKIVNTLGDYPAAVRLVAKEYQVALIDLNTMSRTLYEAWGPEKSVKAFVHYPANTFPNQEKALADNTHFSPYGAYEIAQCIGKGIQSGVPALAKFLRKDLKPFDPANPDDPASFYWPLSPSVSAIKPDGN